MTVLELIEQAAARLTEAQVGFGHGTTNAFDEAAWLVLWRLGLPLDGDLRAQWTVPQDIDQPTWPWPTLRNRFCSANRPMIGRPLGVAGRRPAQGWMSV